MSTVRTRYSPSPSGTLHIGGARTALFNDLFARRNGGVFVLRIEDTDQARVVEGSADAMMEGMRALGIRWQEGPDVGGSYGPYRQSERGERYRAALEQVEASGHAYRCYCTPEELEAGRARQRAAGEPPRYPGTCRNLSDAERAARGARPHVLRLRVPDTGETVVDDLIRGRVTFDNRVLDDFVIRRSDGSAIYNFAVVVDDVEMGITHVIRGEEHLSNTPRQILVYRALGAALPYFAHVPMILAPDRSKLSKRHGATAVGEYFDMGILPEALVNYLTLLGWSDPDGREFLTVADAAAVFDLDRVQHTAAVYDQKKLVWMNAQYLRMLPVERVADAVRPFLRALGVDPDEPVVRPAVGLQGAVELTRERAHTLAELADAMAFLFQPLSGYEDKGRAKHFGPGTDEVLDRLAEHLETLESWTPPDLEARYSELADALGLPRARLIHPTRLALTGRSVGPGLFELMAALGRPVALARLRDAGAYIAAGDVTQA